MFNVILPEECVSRYSDSLRAGRPGDRFFAPVQTSSGAHPASCTNVPGLFPRCKAAGAWCDLLLLAPRLTEEYGYISTPPLGLHGLF